MMLNLLRAVGALYAASVVASGTSYGKIMDIKWDQLPALPPSPGQTRQAGPAGPFVGAQGDVLFVGGGANFPAEAPWEGGAKKWWGDLFVLECSADGTTRWASNKAYRLPRPIAYGFSFSSPDGVICAGGCDAAQCYSEVFQLTWNPATRGLATTAMPPLPAPLAFMGGAQVGEVLYVAGGQQTVKDAVPSQAFFALDLAQKNNPEKFKWQTLPAWPGPARIVPVVAASGGKFYLFGGRSFRVGEPTQILTDAYAYDPATRTWKKLSPIGGTAKPFSVMAGTSATAPDGEILVFSGDRGDLYLKLESYDLQADALRKKLADADAAMRTSFQQQIDACQLAKKKIYGTHPGFGREVLGYDPAHDTWRVVTVSPVPGQVTTIAVPWAGGVVIPGGEVRPGIRTANIERATLVNQ